LTKALSKARYKDIDHIIGEMVHAQAGRWRLIRSARGYGVSVTPYRRLYPHVDWASRTSGDTGALYARDAGLPESVLKEIRSEVRNGPGDIAGVLRDVADAMGRAPHGYTPAVWVRREFTELVALLMADDEFRSELFLAISNAWKILNAADLGNPGATPRDVLELEDWK
jgi:hypothetical protein